MAFLHKKGDLFITIADVDNSFLPKNIYIPKNSILLYLESPKQNKFVKEAHLGLKISLEDRHKMLFKNYIVYITDYSLKLYYKKIKTNESTVNRNWRTL